MSNYYVEYLIEKYKILSYTEFLKISFIIAKLNIIFLALI